MAVLPPKQRYGMTDIKEIAYNLCSDLIDSGFTLVFPTTSPPNAAGIVTGNYIFTPSEAIDPLSTADLTEIGTGSAQPWVLAMTVDITKATISFVTGTPIQIPTDANGTIPLGTVTTYDAKPKSGSAYKAIPGMIGAPKSSISIATDDILFIDRSAYVTGSTKNNYPASYSITVVSDATSSKGNNGIALAYWEAGFDDITDNFSWFVIQRPVNNQTGLINVSQLTSNNKSPLFCLYSIHRISPLGIETTLPPQFFVVREYDVYRPTAPINATVDSTNVKAIIPSGTISLISILESGSYNVQFISGLNTMRFSYPNDELDLIGYTSANVISTSQQANFTVYGESNQRSYLALPASAAYNTNLRLLMRVA
jgi:hypothetical protein